MLNDLARYFSTLSNNYYTRWMNTGANWDYNMAKLMADISNFIWKNSRRQ